MFPKRRFHAVGVLLLICLVGGLCIGPGPEIMANASSPRDVAIEFLQDNYAQKGLASSEAEGVGTYTAAVLAAAGVDIDNDAWKYEGKTLKEAVQGAIEADLSADPQSQDAPPAKRLAQHLLAAKVLGLDCAGLLKTLREREKSNGGFDGNLFSDVPAYDLIARAGYINEFAKPRDYLVNSQAQDGSWGSVWGSDYFPDFMTTTQAIRVLLAVRSDDSDEAVSSAVERGLNYLKAKQNDDGSFAHSAWDDPLIDTVEVIASLRVAGIDPSSWQRNGKSGIDYVNEKALNEDGTFGACKNAMDATWALWGYELIGERLTLDPSNVTVEEGKQVSIKCYWHSGGSSTEVTGQATWTAEDKGLFSVANGAVTGIKQGTAQLRVTYRGLGAQAEVTVVAAETLPPSGGSGGSSVVKITAGVAVVGRYGELLCPPRNVVLSDRDKWGLTAMGALDAAGLPYSLSPKWDGFVEAIAGQRNEGYSGWCYVVNGVVPSVLAKDYNLRAGDKVIWYYSTDMSMPVPKWEDLLRKQSAGITSVEAAVSDSVKKAVERARTGTLTTAEAVTSVLNELKGITKVSGDLRENLVEAAELFTSRVATLPEAVLVEEQTLPRARIAVNEDELGDFLKLRKDVKAFLARLRDLGLFDQGNQPAVSTELPVMLSALAEKSRVELALPRGAVDKLVSENLSLDLKTQNFSIYLPEKTLKNYLTSSAEELVLSVGTSLDSASLFRGASLLHHGVVDLEAGMSVEGAIIRFAVASAVADHGGLGVYYLKGNDWEYIGGKLEPTGWLSCDVKGQGTYVAALFGAKFADMESHWAKDAVDFLARRLIVKGVGEDRFAPEEKVTRTQFAALLARTMGLKGVVSRPVFRDVPVDHWASGAVEALFGLGLISGTDAGLFEPDRYISREEMAVAFARALDIAGVAPALGPAQVDSLLGVYGDAGEVAPWARHAMAVCIASGVMQGRPRLELAPKDTATRGETAAMVMNFLQRLGKL